MSLEKYRIRRPVVALVRENDAYRAYTVPVAAIVTVERTDTTRLLEVEWDGKRVWMFGLDIANCGDRIE